MKMCIYTEMCWDNNVNTIEIYLDWFSQCNEYVDDLKNEPRP